MNGDYLISNGHPNGKFTGNYSELPNVDYFDVYSPNVTTRYGEVFWTMTDPVDLPQEIIEKFKGKTMAIVGYEADQVYKTENGDISIPITHQYNHHYIAYMTGSNSKLVLHNASESHNMDNHGATEYWRPAIINQTNSTIP